MLMPLIRISPPTSVQARHPLLQSSPATSVHATSESVIDRYASEHPGSRSAAHAVPPIPIRNIKRLSLESQDHTKLSVRSGRSRGAHSSRSARSEIACSETSFFEVGDLRDVTAIDLNALLRSPHPAGSECNTGRSLKPSEVDKFSDEASGSCVSELHNLLSIKLDMNSLDDASAIQSSKGAGRSGPSTSSQHVSEVTNSCANTELKNLITINFDRNGAKQNSKSSKAASDAHNSDATASCCPTELRNLTALSAKQNSKSSKAASDAHNSDATASCCPSELRNLTALSADGILEKTSAAA